MHLQPPGKKPLAWLKVIQTVPSHLPKAWILCLQLSSPTYSRSTCVKLLSLSFLQLFISLQSSSGADPWQRPVILLLNPYLQALFPRLARTPHTGIPPPPPSLGETVPWIGCCAVESQPLMGSGGESESESEGGGRREENPAEKE